MPSRIALFCLQDAEIGGESLVTTNKLLTKNIPIEIKNYIKNCGGVLYERNYYDLNNNNNKDIKINNPWAMSWQEKCGISISNNNNNNDKNDYNINNNNDREKAINYFLKLKFEKEKIVFDENGNLKITFVHPGFITDIKTGCCCCC